jgi:RNA methyltransferase, TrmH family
VKLLTLARDLQRRKARERQQLFVAEGVRTVETLFASPLTIRGVLVSATGAASERGQALVVLATARGVPVQQVTDDEFASAADTEAPQGVLAVAAIPRHSLPPAAPATRYLVLDALQDPGNVGTVIRTAAALGVSATIALPGTVDPWNAKVVRGSMGAVFSHPVVPLDWAATAAFAAHAGVALWAATMNGDPLELAAAGRGAGALALVVGNEGAGVSPHVAAAVTRTVCIPMAPGVESLNVAVATGILLYALQGTPSGA